jgi:DNA polymerase sigma
MSLPYQAAESFLRNQDQIVSVLSETSKLLAEPSIYERIREDIKAMTIFSVDKVDSVNFFGSRFIGLGTEESDLDIFIKVGKDSFAKTKKSQSDFTRYEKAFKDQENWLVEKTVPSASIPIITCIYLPLRLHCK